MPEDTKSKDPKSLEMRVAELEDKLSKMHVTEEELKAFQKVSSLMGGGAGAAGPAAGCVADCSGCINECAIRACTIVRYCTIIRYCTIVRNCIRDCFECGGGWGPAGGGIGGGFGGFGG